MKRKVKSMAQLLSEFPNYKFEDKGLLVINDDLCISSDNFEYFGKEVEYIYPSYWDERLLEPMSKPLKRGKLYAYQEESSTQVVWVDWDIPEDSFRNGGAKKPQYNLDFNEIDELVARVEALIARSEVMEKRVDALEARVNK